MSQRLNKTVTILFTSAVVLFTIFSCRESSNKADQAGSSDLVIFHAGSLSVPLREVSNLFAQSNPEINIKPEAAGSRDTARKVSDLGRACDVLASADYQVIDNLLMPENAKFNIYFATNEMGIAYTDKSKQSENITQDNWSDILLDQKINLGRADPDSDPCGYRTEMVFQLAERYYKTHGLAQALQAKHGKRYIRPKETDLLALLESGEIDYIFIYRSVAMQHNLKFLRLPDEINLRSNQHSDLYKTAVVGVTGKTPGQMITRKGAPIVYSVTIPQNAENRDIAIKYIQLLLSPQGREILTKNGQGPIVPALTKQYDLLPEKLKPYCKQIQ